MKRTLILIAAARCSGHPHRRYRPRHVLVAPVGRRRGIGLHRQFDPGSHPRRLQGPHALPVREGHPQAQRLLRYLRNVLAPLLTRGRPTARGKAAPSLLGTIRRADGTTQVTYAGHPLYRYLPDARPGQTNGQDSHDFGAGWYVLSPGGQKIEADEPGNKAPEAPRY